LQKIVIIREIHFGHGKLAADQGRALVFMKGYLNFLHFNIWIFCRKFDDFVLIAGPFNKDEDK